MKTRLYYTFVVGTAIAMSNMRVPAQAQNQPAITAVTDKNPSSSAQRALSLLKPAADRLSAAKAFTFKTHSMVEVVSPVGQMLSYCSTSRVAVQRPNKMTSKMNGEGPTFDLYYDGKNFSGVDPELGFYAQLDAPPTLDEMLPFIMDKTGIYLPSADMLSSDVYASLTQDLTNAYWVGKSFVDGVACDHLAFAAPGIGWQIWVGPEKDPLPRRLMVTKLNMAPQPQFRVTFSNWEFEPSLSARHFEFKKPAGAKQVEFRPLMA